MTTQVNRTQIPRRPMNAAKLMVVPFFDWRGLVEVAFYRNTTINQTKFATLVHEVNQILRIRRGLRVWRNRDHYLLHMDNAPPHRGVKVRNALQATRWPRLMHPPYSPDLSPCDFFLFPLLKKHLCGREFADTERLTTAILNEISDITSDQWKNCFRDWIHRCRRCIVFNGGYFEGMKFLPDQQ